ncbi:unnamed protein product, partial [Effrenium voratum]
IQKIKVWDQEVDTLATDMMYSHEVDTAHQAIAQWYKNEVAIWSFGSLASYAAACEKEKQFAADVLLKIDVHEELDGYDDFVCKALAPEGLALTLGGPGRSWRRSGEGWLPVDTKVQILDSAEEKVLVPWAFLGAFPGDQGRPFFAKACPAQRAECAESRRSKPKERRRLLERRRGGAVRRSLREQKARREDRWYGMTDEASGGLALVPLSGLSGSTIERLLEELDLLRADPDDEELPGLLTFNRIIMHHMVHAGQPHGICMDVGALPDRVKPNPPSNNACRKLLEAASQRERERSTLDEYEACEGVDTMPSKQDDTEQLVQVLAGSRETEFLTLKRIECLLDATRAIRSGSAEVLPEAFEAQNSSVAACAGASFGGNFQVTSPKVTLQAGTLGHSRLDVLERGRSENGIWKQRLKRAPVDWELAPMSHRAGTGDAPIPGLVTSRRNPAYKQRLQKQKEAEAAAEAARRAQIAQVKAAKQLHKSRRRRSPGKRSRSPSRRKEKEVRETSEEREERRSREKKEAEAKALKAQKDAEEKKKRAAEEAENRKRWAEQEAKWAEERRLREEQKKLEEERKVARQQKLKGAFAMADDDEDDEEQRKKELQKKQKSRAPLAAAPASSVVVPAATASRPKAEKDGQDPISLRASLADPSGPRVHSPGEVAEHFRRLSEMKRRFRRTEFGGPRKRTPSRSRSREKYNSARVCIKEKERSRGRD